MVVRWNQKSLKRAQGTEKRTWPNSENLRQILRSCRTIASFASTLSIRVSLRDAVNWLLSSDFACFSRSNTIVDQFAMSCASFPVESGGLQLVTTTDFLLITTCDLDLSFSDLFVGSGAGGLSLAVCCVAACLRLADSGLRSEFSGSLPKEAF